MNQCFQCDLSTGEPIFLSDLQPVIEKSPFDHVLKFDDISIEDGIVKGKNYEGRIVEICSEDEFIIFDEE